MRNGKACFFTFQVFLYKAFYTSGTMEVQENLIRDFRWVLQDDLWDILDKRTRKSLFNILYDDKPWNCFPYSLKSKGPINKFYKQKLVFLPLNRSTILSYEYLRIVHTNSLKKTCFLIGFIRTAFSCFKVFIVENNHKNSSLSTSVHCIAAKKCLMGNVVQNFGCYLPNMILNKFN